MVTGFPRECSVVSSSDIRSTSSSCHRVRLLCSVRGRGVLLRKKARPTNRSGSVTQVSDARVFMGGREREDGWA